MVAGFMGDQTQQMMRASCVLARCGDEALLRTDEILKEAGFRTIGLRDRPTLEAVPGGTRVVLVSQPLADATTVVWPLADGDTGGVGQVVAGRLTLTADVEAALAAGGEDQGQVPAPPVVVAVGGASGEELVALLRRVLAGRGAATPT